MNLINFSSFAFKKIALSSSSAVMDTTNFETDEMENMLQYIGIGRPSIGLEPKK